MHYKEHLKIRSYAPCTLGFGARTKDLPSMEELVAIDFGVWTEDPLADLIEISFGEREGLPSIAEEIGRNQELDTSERESDSIEYASTTAALQIRRKAMEICCSSTESSLV